MNFSAAKKIETHDRLKCTCVHECHHSEFTSVSPGSQNKHLKKKNIQEKFKICDDLFKLDGVGPIDNRPSTD